MKFKATRLTIVFLISTSSAFGQFFEPLPVIDKGGQTINRALEKQRIEAFNAHAIPSKYKSDYLELYKGITLELTEGVKNGQFLDVPEIQLKVTSMLNLLATNSGIPEPKTVLIVNNPFVNARCHGEGTISIYIGLISRVKHDGELAFVLAHELAHYQLDHVHQRMQEIAEGAYAKEAQKEMERMKRGDATFEGMQSVMKSKLGFGKLSRATELEADAAALKIMAKSGYTLEDAIDGLKMLDKALEPKYALRNTLFDAFIYDKYAFQRRWLDQRPSVFSSEKDRTPLESHPDIDVRIEQLQSMGIDAKRRTEELDLTDEISIGELQSVAAAYEMKYYDFAIHQALQLHKRDPNQAYLSAVVGRCMLDLTKAKSDNNVPDFVPMSTVGYSAETRALNDFLHNITYKDCLNLGYNYSKRYFNKNHPEHYRVRYQFAEMLGRFEESKYMKKSFKEKFPNEKLEGNMLLERLPKF